MTLAPEDDAVRARAARVRLLCLDVDGVLTDGRLYFLTDGVEAKSFNIRDGLGLKLLMSAGVRTAIITGRRSPAARARAGELGLNYFFEAVEDKRAVASGLAKDLGLSMDALAAMGDDLPDLPMMRAGGLALTVPDAPALVKQHAHYVTRQQGGMGAVREACEFILQCQGRFDDLQQGYLT